MRIKPSLAGFLAGSAVTATVMLTLGADAPPHYPVGRFQLASNETRAYVIDTVNGRVWTQGAQEGRTSGEFAARKADVP